MDSVTRWLEVVGPHSPDGGPNSPDSHGVRCLPPAQVAIVGDTPCVKDTLPIGVVSAAYVVTAHKGTHASAPSNPCVVRFAPAREHTPAMQHAA